MRKIAGCGACSGVPLALGDAAGAGLATAFAGASQFEPTGGGGTIEAVVQFLAEGAACKVAVDFPLPLAMALHHNTCGHMGETYFVIRLIHLLPALAAAAGELLFQIGGFDSQSFHVKLELLQLFR